MPRIGFVSLGCPKALVDSERILSELRVSGYDLVDSYEGADLVVVNTCGFITPAVEESLGAIGEALERNGRVVVTGCLGTRPDEILARHPRVMAITGEGDVAGVMRAVRAAIPLEEGAFTGVLPLASDATGRPQGRGIKLTPRHYSYLKIAEGCDHRCSFCIIPSMRGDQRSRDAADVLYEATRLVATGTKELIVIAQDSSAYGTDLRHRESDYAGRSVRAHLVPLVRELASLGAWVRLHYVYPYPHVRDLIPLMADGALLPYLDVPLQHASPRVLRAMRRPGGAESHLATIASWRAICPELVIRSTFIVGFPGETEAEFEELLTFLSEAQLDRVGAFTYSDVPGAAANALADPVPEAVKLERYARLMELQLQISRARLAARVGTTVQAIVDDYGALPGELVARTRGDAPEIDGVLRLDSDGTVKIGDVVEARIVASDDHDSSGVVVRTVPWRPGVPSFTPLPHGPYAPTP
ncbi:30S ribosomal protein S12 methylthiotransferase RimO [soil metagenome]